MRINTETILPPLTESMHLFDIGANMLGQEESPSALADPLKALTPAPIASPYDIDTSQFKTFNHDPDVAKSMLFSECVVALRERTLTEQKEVLGHPYLWERIQYALDAYPLNIYATSDDEREVSSAFLLMKQTIEVASEDFLRALSESLFDTDVGLMPVEVDASWVHILNQQVAPWLKGYMVSLRILYRHSVYDMLETGLQFMRLVQGYTCLHDYACFFNQLCDVFCDPLCQDIMSGNDNALGVVQYNDKAKTLWQHYWSVPSAVRYTYHYLDGKQCELTERGEDVLAFPWSKAENAIPLGVYAKCVCLLASSLQRNAWEVLYTLVSHDACPAYGENVLMDAFLAQTILSSWFNTLEEDRIRLLEVRYMQDGKPLLQELALGVGSSGYDANLWLSVIGSIRKTSPDLELSEKIRYYFRAVCGCNQDWRNAELWDQTLDCITTPINDVDVHQQALIHFSRLLEHPCSQADKANVFMGLQPACWQWIMLERRNDWKYVLSLFLQRVLDDQGIDTWLTSIATQFLQNEQACRINYVLLWVYVTHYLCSNDQKKVCDITSLMFDKVDSLASENDKNTCYLLLGVALSKLKRAPHVYKVLERVSFIHALTMSQDKSRLLFSRIVVDCIVAQRRKLFQRPVMMQVMHHVLSTNHCLGQGKDRYKWLYKQLFVMTFCLYTHGLDAIASDMQRALVAWGQDDAQGLYLSEMYKRVSEGRLAPSMPDLMVFAQRVFERRISEYQLQLLVMLQCIAYPAINRGDQLQDQQALNPWSPAATTRPDLVGASLFTPDTKRQKTVDSFARRAASASSVSELAQTAGASGLGAVVATSTGERRESPLSNHGVFTGSEGKKAVARYVNHG